MKYFSIFLDGSLCTHTRYKNEQTLYTVFMLKKKMDNDVNDYPYTI